jgi:hypothetical protein
VPGINCHFVSRFLTRPWEHGDRHLWYFDFEQGEVRSHASKTLFSETGTNTADVEARLNAVIETPISAAIARLVDDVQPERQLEWPLFRALALLMMIQPLRSSGRPDRAERLEDTVMRSDGELDGIARAALDSYQLGRISVRPDAAVLYPAAGFFPLLGRRKDDDYYAAAIAIPVSQRHVFVGVPRTIDWDSATAQWASNGAGTLANASVGTSGRVVLPPLHMEGYATEEIAGMLYEMRATSTQLMALCRERNEALTRLNESFGL